MWFKRFFSRKPAATSQDNALNSVYTDPQNGLMWQRKDDGIKRTYDEAKAYSKALNLNGYNDWRIPSLGELSSLLIWKNDSNLFINTELFPNTKSDPYWTSSLDGSCVYHVIIFDREKYNDIIFTSMSIINTSTYVRCVRGYSKDATSPTKTRHSP